jgi:hypothetical protein
MSHIAAQMNARVGEEDAALNFAVLHLDEMFETPESVDRSKSATGSGWPLTQGG